MRWAECDIAFNRRLQIGLLINSVHKDISVSLYDVFVLFEERIKSVLNRQGLLNVYTAFVTKFIKVVKNSEIKLDLTFLWPNYFGH